jgi:hypothetical protein
MGITQYYPCLQRSQCDRTRLLLVIFALVTTLWPLTATGQNAAAPKLKLAEIEQLVTHHVPDTTLSNRIQRFGLDFAPNPTIVESLRSKGAGPLTLSAIEKFFPRSEVHLLQGIKRYSGLIQATFVVHLFKQDGWFDTGIPITDELNIHLYPPSDTRWVQVMISKTIVALPTDPNVIFVHLVGKDGSQSETGLKRSQDIVIPEKSIFHPLKVRVLSSDGAPEEVHFNIVVIIRGSGVQAELSTVQQHEEQALMKQAAALPPPEVQPPAPAAIQTVQATHFSAQEVHTTNDVWTDPATGLMWTRKDNGSDVTWQQAVDYCRNLQLADYRDWRLPTLDELQGINDPIADVGGWQLKSNLQLSSWWQWSNLPGNASGEAWTFKGRFGKWGPKALDYSTDRRALCVRRSGE